MALKRSGTKVLRKKRKGRRWVVVKQHKSTRAAKRHARAARRKRGR